MSILCKNFIADPCGSSKCAGCGRRRHEHKDMVLVPQEFIEFVKNAPVSSGVCCCGGDMNHSPYEGHEPVDQWDHSLGLWLKEIFPEPLARDHTFTI